MAKPSSKRLKSSKQKSQQKAGAFIEAFRASYAKYREKIWQKKRARLRLHQSFKRSYREDYARKLNVPGLLYHTMDTFRIILRNWRHFLPLIIFAVVFNVALVGLMSEETYVKFQDTLAETSDSLKVGEVGNLAKASLLLISTVTTGGLSSGLSEVQIVFAVISFLLIWLITIYLLRHLLAQKTVRLRDAFYNACSPLISSFLVFFVAMLQSIPILLVVVTYSTAVQTDFLSTPFYALVYFIFAAVMLLLSLYLLSSTLMALIAVSAPGLYPMVAFRTASDLMAGRRTRFVLRLVFLIMALAVVWVIVMLPLITLDLFLKSQFEWLSGFPFVPICLLIMTNFSFVYITAYLYIYYRRVLAYEDDK